MTVSAYLWAIPVFGIIIIMHELGHFSAAKAFGIKVHEFAIGFGPAIGGFTRGETRYSVRLLVILGGFVKMAGMEDGETADPRGFAAKPAWQRMVVIAAGPLMNFVLAALLFAGLFYANGEARTTLIGGVVPDSPAAAAGLQTGDQVLQVNAAPVSSWLDLQQAIEISRGQPLALTVARGGQTVNLIAAARLDSETGRHLLGILPQRDQIGIATALGRGSALTGLVTIEWFRTVWQWIQQQIAPDVVGPVGIVRHIAESSRAGLLNLIELAALLSINIGIVNLIPIPALDGSRLAFIGFEALRGRRIDPLRENVIHWVGLMVLLGLVLLITLFKDLPSL